ncbi:MAG TPA: hypothetical protein VF585_04490 [Chthoniobacterales bacterium]|jgi:hypothetical protein
MVTVPSRVESPSRPRAPVILITWVNHIIQGESRREAAAVTTARPFILVTFPSADDVRDELVALESLLEQQSTATSKAIDE